MKELLKRYLKSPPKMGILILFGVTVLLGVGYFVATTWIRPLGPALELPTSTPRPTETSPPTSTPEPGKTAVPTITPTPTIQPVCGGPNSMTILISGVAREDYEYGLADAIRVARVDFQTQKVTVLAIPRGLWVEIPGIEDETGVTEGLLNQSYFYGTKGMGYVEGAANGSGSLALTLQKNFGLRVDHYLAVNLFAFRNIVDGIGGVRVCFPEDVYIKRFGEPKLYREAGCYQLTGEEAEKIARARIGIGGYGRMQNQTRILRAVAGKMLAPSTLTRLPDIVQQLIDYTMTDLSPSQISKLICLARKIDPQEDITFAQISDDILVERKTYFAPLKKEIFNMVEKEEGALEEIFQLFQVGEYP